MAASGMDSSPDMLSECLLSAVTLTSLSELVLTARAVATLERTLWFTNCNGKAGGGAKTMNICAGPD